MKTKFIILITILLTACSSSGTTPNNTSTPTVLLATKTKTPVPIATKEPTPTQDPKPIGATEKDADGNWIKIVAQENGVTRTWSWDKERGVYTTMLLTGYYEPTTPEWQKTQPWRAYIPLAVMVDEPIAGADSLPLFTMRPNNGEAISWTNNHGTLLAKALVKAGFYSSIDDWNSDAWFDGKHLLRYDFVTQQGEQSWGLWNDAPLHNGKETRVEVHIVAEGKAEDGFSKVSTEYTNYGPVTDFMIKLSTKDNNLIVEIALDPTRSLADLPRRLWIWMLNYGPSVVLDSCADRSTTCDLTILPSWSQMLDQLVLNEKRLTPWFDADLEK